MIPSSEDDSAIENVFIINLMCGWFGTVMYMLTTFKFPGISILRLITLTSVLWMFQGEKVASIAYFCMLILDTAIFLYQYAHIFESLMWGFYLLFFRVMKEH